MLTWLKNQLFDGKKRAGEGNAIAAGEQAKVSEVPIGTSDAYKEQGDALVKAGQWEEAAHCYREAIALNAKDAQAHNHLGDIFYAQNDWVQAQAAYHRALEIQPDFTEAGINLGLTLDLQGRFSEAEACYRMVLEHKPGYWLAHYNLGVALKNQGRYAEAEECYRRALEGKAFAEGYYGLGMLLRQQGRLGEAETCYRRVLDIKPDHIEARGVLAELMMRQGRLPDAEASYRRILEITPNDGVAHYNLAIVLQEQGKSADAEAGYRQALEIKPDFAEAHNNLGNALKDFGRLSEAELSYRSALDLDPDFAEAYCNLGGVLHSQGRLSEAEAYYRRALELKPDSAEVHSYLADALRALHRLSEAETSAYRALAIKPDFANAHNNLGNLFNDLHRLYEAEASYRSALKFKPNYAEAHCNLAVVLQNQGRLSEAEASHRRALELKPDFVEAYSNLLFTLNYHPDLSGKQIFAAYQAFDERFGAVHRAQWRRHDNNREPGRRLKVGYVSPDLNLHAVRHFLEPLLSQHDKREVEVYAYAELATEDAMTARYKTYVEHWIATLGMPSAVLAEQIRADGIDILVDLAGHTARNRLDVFMRKPAPVSLSWLGYGYSTGLAAIDYLLTDETSAPPGSDELFAERPWRLATPGYVYRPAEGMGVVSSLPAAERGYVTFGTLTRAARINQHTIRVWSTILKQVAGSRLVIDSSNFQDIGMQTVMAEKFAAHGIERARLEIGCHSPPWDTLRGLDIGLDCFPHNSGTTLFETLFMGVPYVTLAGRPSVGRLGSAILEGVGHPEWIARSEEEYIEKVVQLAGDLATLARVRRDLRAEMQSSALMDEAGFARKVEVAYRTMWVQWVNTSHAQ